MSIPQAPLREVAAQADGLFTLPWVAYFSRLSKITVNSMTFAGVWANYSTSYASGSYWMDNSGMVHLSGVVKRPGATGVGETITTLPAGFRPAAHELFIADCGAGPAEVSITAAGVVSLTGGTAATYLSLSGISFLAA